MTITKEQIAQIILDSSGLDDCVVRAFEAGAKSAAVDSQDLTIAYMAGRHDAQKSAMSEPVQFMSSDELKPRTPAEKKAYQEGVEDGKIYAVRDGLAAPPAEAKREPLDILEILDWWSSENGLENCRMRVSTDFIQMVRAVEKRHNIGAKE